MSKIIKNAAQCKLCGEVIESKHVHDCVVCKCGSCMVDGGHAYLRRGYRSEEIFIDLSVVED